MKNRFIALAILVVVLSGCSSMGRASKNGSKDREADVEVPVIADKKEEEETSTEEKEETVAEKEPTKEVEDAPKYADIKRQYIEDYKDVAMEEMRVYKIPASITLAQGILESSSGVGELTKKSNNHFGIKCHKGWNGGRTYHDDDEKGECFRVYDDPRESFKDHSLFLAERSRYQGLFQLKITDYKGWARGLKAAGYATDPKYPNKLIKLIEDYHLYDYDKQVLGKKVPNREEAKTYKGKEPKHHIVTKGDTLYSLSRRYDLTVKEIMSINGLDDVGISIGQKLYLERD